MLQGPGFRSPLDSAPYMPEETFQAQQMGVREGKTCWESQAFVFHQCLPCKSQIAGKARGNLRSSWPLERQNWLHVSLRTTQRLKRHRSCPKWLCVFKSFSHIWCMSFVLNKLGKLKRCVSFCTNKFGPSKFLPSQMFVTNFFDCLTVILTGSARLSKEYGGYNWQG